MTRRFSIIYGVVYIINFVYTGIESLRASLVPVPNMINYAGGRTVKVNWDRNESISRATHRSNIRFGHQQGKHMPTKQ